MRVPSAAGAGRQSLAAAVMEEPSLRQAEPSPARSESPVYGGWDNFPISEFILVLYEPVQRVQLLPFAIADAL